MVCVTIRRKLLTFISSSLGTIDIYSNHPSIFHLDKFSTDNFPPTVTRQFTAPDWIERRSRHRIWLKDIYPYVFCQKYKKKHQFKKHGEFEIYFVNEDGEFHPSLIYSPFSSALKGIDEFFLRFKTGNANTMKPPMPSKRSSEKNPKLGQSLMFRIWETTTAVIMCLEGLDTIEWFIRFCKVGGDIWVDFGDESGVWV